MMDFLHQLPVILGGMGLICAIIALPVAYDYVMREIEGN